MVFAAGSVLLLQDASAVTRTWLVSSGSWNDPANWSGSAVPTSNIDAVVDNDGTISILTGVSGKAENFYLGVTTNCAMGISGGSLGTDASYLGSGTGSVGMATISSGSWNSTNLYVGNEGTGILISYGGLVSSSTASLGVNAGSNGMVDVMDGAWNSSSFTVGELGDGTLSISGSGVVKVTGGSKTLMLATGVGSTGVLNVGTGGTAGRLDANAVAGGSGSATVNFNHVSTLTFAPQLTGTITVNKLGSGTTILTGNNSYTGTTTISEGTLQVGSGGSTGTLGSGEVVDNSVLAFNRSGTLTVSNAISGTGSVFQLGQGTTILSGSNTYSGTTSVTRGFLQLNDDSGLGASSLVVDGGGIVYGAAFNDLRSVAVGTKGATFNTNGFDVSFGQVISGSGSITKTGAGIFAVTGSNTYSGSTQILGGTLQLGDGTTDGSLGSGNIVNNAILAANLTQNTVLANTISGNGQFVQMGSGTLTVSGTNSYNGGTVIEAGVLRVGNVRALGSANGSLTVDSGALDLNGFGITVGALSGTGASALVTNNGSDTAFTVKSNANTTYAGMIADGSGAIQLIKSGNGTLILTGSNSYTGGTVINSGRLQLGDETTGGTITGNVANAGILAFNYGTNAAFGGIISGKGKVEQNGVGTTLTLTAANTYTGDTLIAAGAALAVVDGGSTGAVKSKIVDSGTLVANFSGTGVLSNKISGSGKVVQNGSGLLILNGDNKHTGGTVVNSGTLRVGNSKALGSSSTPLEVNGGTLDLNGMKVGVGVLSGTSAAAVITNQAATAATLTTNVGTGVVASFAGVIQNGGAATALAKSGDGTLSLTGNNTYGGGTTINAGTLIIGDGGTHGSISGNVNIKKGTLTFNRGDAYTFGGAISGKGGVQQLSSGTLTLTGANTFTGGTFINGGVLQVGSETALGSKKGVNLNGGVLATDGNQHQINVSGNLIWNSDAKIALTLTPDLNSEMVNVIGSLQLVGSDPFVFDFTPVGLPPGHTNFLVMTVSKGFGSITADQFDYVSDDPGFEGNFIIVGNNLIFQDGYEPAVTGFSELNSGLNVGTVPEPSTWILLAMALAFGLSTRRRRVQSRS